MDALLDFVENGMGDAFFYGYGAGFLLGGLIMGIRGLVNAFVRIIKS